MAGRPPARHSDRGSWDGGYRDGAYRDSAYQDGEYRDGEYRDAGYRGGDDWDAGYQSGDDWDAGYQGGDDWDAGYRDAGHRDGGYRDSGYRQDGYPDGGYRDRESGGYGGRGSGYRERGGSDRGRGGSDPGRGGSDPGRGGSDPGRGGRYRDHGERGYPDRRADGGYADRLEDGVHAERRGGGARAESRAGAGRQSAGRDRGAWGDAGIRSRAGQDQRGWGDRDRPADPADRDWGGGSRAGRVDEDRRAWAGDSRAGWGDEAGAGWGDEAGAGWADEPRARRAGRDRHSWDDDVWDGEDEDSGEYREAVDDSTGGAEGNERLTALTGSLLLVLFAAEGVTILSVHQLLTLHFFLGMLLIGPVALKACAVLYRFARYYTGAAEYVRKGPPAPLLRLLGPIVMITSLSVLATGVMLAVVGPSGAGIWLFLHRASFILWFGAMTVHVLAYVWRLPRLISGDLVTRASYRTQEILAGRSARWLLLGASVLAGLLLAMLTIHRTGLWFAIGPQSHH